MSTETTIGLRIDPAAIYAEADIERALGVKPSTLRTARREGSLRFAKRGRSIFYRGEWVLAWIESEQESRDTGGRDGS